MHAQPDFIFQNATSCPQETFMCFIRISEQTAIISVFSSDWSDLQPKWTVYCAVRILSTNI